MNPLLKRLATLRIKVRLLDGWQGACALIALALGVALVVGIIDFFIHLPTLVRAAALVGLLVGSGSIFYRFVVRPFGKRCDDLNLALRVEEAYPELNDALASTVQFLKQSESELARVGGSPAMRERTVADALEKASKFDFSRILDRKAALLFGLAAIAAVLLAGTVVALQRDYSRIAFLRLVEPFGGHTWTQVAVYRLKNDKADLVDGNKDERLAIGQPYLIRVDLTGQLPERFKQAKIEIDGQIRTDTTVEVKRKDGVAFFEKLFDVASQQQREFKFRILYNDGTFPSRANTWHVVKVLPQPKLVPLDNQPSPQITITPPQYTDLPQEHRLLPGTRDVQMFAGSKVVYRARADRPLTEAWLSIRPTHEGVMNAGLFAAMANPVYDVARMVAGQAVWARIPVTLDETDKSVMTAHFTAWLDGRYTLHMRDEYELEGEDGGNLHVLNDPVPEVKLQRPSAAVTRRPDGKLDFKFNITDEQFAVKTVFVEYRKKLADGSWDEPSRTVLFDAKNSGALIPELLAKANWLAPGSARTYPRFPTNRDKFGKPVELRLRPKKLDLESIWSLRNQFKEGEVIEIQVCADDFCDIFPFREPGRSSAILLTIVSKRDLTRDAGIKMGQIQDELKRLRNLEQQALDGVKEMKAKDKVDAKDVENFIDGTEGPQRTVKERIGTAQEGLRKDLADLRRELKDNNLEDSQAYREAGEIKGALDNIADKELQKIEPNIADIRKDLTQTGKNTPKTKERLQQTEKMQQNVVDSLNELLQKMDPVGKMNDQKATLREIIEKEKKIMQDLEELNTRKQELEKEFPDQKDRIEKDQQEKIAQKAREQLEVTQQLEKLIKEMRAEKEQLEKAGNKEDAKKLEEAIEKLEKPNAEPMPKQLDKKPTDPVNAQMRQVAKDLKQKSEAPPQTINKQKEILQELENALDALEGKNEDLTKQEIQKRQEAEKKIDEQIKDLQKLRDQAKKIEMNPDKEERLKQKQELAKKMEKAVDDIEAMRRQLARLQEQRAANDANQAADKVDQARQKADMGDNPDQDLKQAQEDLERAKAELQKAEEQLAREMLIRIADQLKDLKARQDAVLQRSEDFHPKVLNRKIWSDGLLDAIEGNMEAQKDIGEETDGIKEKLKGAKVIHGILEGAKKAMDGAGETMKNRREAGKERRQEQMDAKELEDENEWQAETLRHQKLAARKLGHIIDALKEEIAKKKTPKKDQVAKKDPKDPKEPKDKPMNQRQGDGLPPMTELKLLKAEQLDLNERTEDFAKRNPNLKDLTDAQRRELRDLEAEQERLQELFQQILPPAALPKEGDMP